MGSGALRLSRSHMTSPRPLTACLLGACLVGVMPQSHGVDLQVSGNWCRQVGPADLEAGAGTDFISPLHTTGISPSLTISNTDGTGWTLAARLVDSGLPAGGSVGVRANGGEGINCGANSLTLNSSD
jgi:hypothetical protein